MSRLPHRGLSLAVGALLAVSACAPSPSLQTVKVETPRAAAEALRTEVEALLTSVQTRRERFEVRINRCENPQGEADDEIFHVWIGLRGIAVDGDIVAQLDALHARWQAEGWIVSRWRRLERGGVQLAATHPHSGNAYALDSGFDAGPAHYLVGYFSTPCFRSATGRVAFGPLS